MTLEIDLRIHAQIFLGLYERETYRWLNRLSAGIASAVDVGAADGLYSAYFVKNTSAQVVLAFDPRIGAAASLHEAVARNINDSRRQFEVINQSVGSLQSLKTVTLGAHSSRLPGPVLVKIDVDGGEADVLGGAAPLMQRTDVRWLIETHSLDLENECVELLHGAGLKTRVIPNAWWRIAIPEQRPTPHNRWLVAFSEADGGAAQSQ